MNKYIGSLFLGTLSIGFAPIFVRYIDLSASEIAFYRTFFAGIILLIYLVVSKNKLPRSKNFYVRSAFAGFIFSLDLFLWHKSIKLIGAGIATMLANTQIFYLLFLGLILYQEKMSLKKIAIFLGAFLGVSLILLGQKGFYHSDDFFYGALFGLLTGICYALYTTGLKEIALTDRLSTPLSIVCFASLFTALFSLLICLITGVQMSFPVNDLKPILGLALICQIGGWVFISYGLAKTTLAVSGLIILLQPLIAKILGVFLFKEPFSTIEMLGAIILFICIYFGSQLRRN